MSLGVRRLIAGLGVGGAMCFIGAAATDVSHENIAAYCVLAVACSLLTLTLLPVKPRGMLGRGVGAVVFILTLFNVVVTARGTGAAGAGHALDNDDIRTSVLWFLVIGIPCAYYARTGRFVRAIDLARKYGPQPDIAGWTEKEGLTLHPDQILYMCRQSFGAPPRRFNPMTLRSLEIGRPKWLKAGDGLSTFSENHETLIREGIVVWGKLVQANSQLFRPGQQDCPADILYCLDPTVRNSLHALIPMASELYALKGTEPDNPALREFAAHMTDEMDRRYGLPVPESISPWLPCAVSTTLIHRLHLPNGRLSRGYFPILLNPTEPRIVMVLPSRYWPEAFQKHWVTP